MDRRRLIGAGLGAGALGLATPLRAAASPDPVKKAQHTSGVPALGGLIVGQEGVRYLGVAGARVIGGEAVTPDDQWHIGSNTKAMTAALYGRLVDLGVGHWGAPLARLFPDLAVHPGWATITIDQLFGHRSGLSDVPWITRDWLAAARDGRPPDMVRTALAKAIIETPPARPPGHYDYANANYLLAGAAIERLAGAPFEQALGNQLFTSLGMKSPGFGAPGDHQPQGHPVVDGRIVPLGPDQAADNPPAFAPAGGVHLSLGDYGRFLEEFLGQPALLSPPTIRHLVTPLAGPPPAYAMGWVSVAQSSLTSGPALFHEGSNTRWYMVTVIAPRRRVAVSAVANVADVAGAQSTRTLAATLMKKALTRR